MEPWRNLLLGFLLISSQLSALNCPLDTSTLQKRVHAHLNIGDPDSALLEVQKERTNSEINNLDLLRLEIKCLAAKNNSAALLQSFQTFCTLSQNQANENILDETILEEISWAIMRQGARSSSSLIRQEAVLAAFVTNDAKSIPLCVEGLQDSSLEVRYLSLRLAAHARDDIINQKVYEIFITSQQASDRYAAIQALKNIATKDVQAQLTKLIISDTAPLAERVAAIDSLTQIVRSCTPNYITELLASNRALLRTLACELVLDTQSKNLLPLIIPCLFDESQEVRLAALQCVGILGDRSSINLDSDEFRELLAHKDPKTSLAASWIKLVHSSSNESFHTFTKQLLSSDRELALFAASCIAHAGPHGIPLAVWGIQHVDDSLVCLNLAIALIWQQQELATAQTPLASILSKKQERLSWQNLGIFSWVGPTTVSHVQNSLSLPETEDLLTRLELFTMLASVCSFNLKETLLPLLKERAWGVSSQAASLLIKGGIDDGIDAIKTLKELLADKNPEVALQAAFILANYAQDDAALKVFETQYTQVSRQLKEQIIVGIGQIGSRDSLPFLVDVLNSPFESIRISAARAILLCLYH